MPSGAWSAMRAQVSRVLILSSRRTRFLATRTLSTEEAVSNFFFCLLVRPTAAIQWRRQWDAATNAYRPCHFGTGVNTRVVVQ
jgi:hypothetical protein